MPEVEHEEICFEEFAAVLERFPIEQRREIVANFFTLEERREMLSAMLHSVDKLRHAGCVYHPDDCQLLIDLEKIAELITSELRRLGQLH
jgi:hypothetical protein